MCVCKISKRPTQANGSWTIWGSNHFEPFPHPSTQQQLQRWLSLLPRKVKEHTASDPAVLAQSTRHTAKYHQKNAASSGNLGIKFPRNTILPTTTWSQHGRIHNIWSIRCGNDEDLKMSLEKAPLFPVFYLDWHPSPQGACERDCTPSISVNIWLTTSPKCS